MMPAFRGMSRRPVLVLAAAAILAAAAATAQETPEPLGPLRPALEAPEAGEGEAPADASAPGSAADAAPQPLRLGVLAGRDVMATLAATEPMTEGLSSALGRAVEILPMSSFGAMIDAQVMRRIDGGFYSTAAFATAQAQCSCLEPIVAPAAGDGTLAYHAVIVTRQGSGIASVLDLQGRTVAAGPDDSVGGRRIQLAGLAAEGIELAGFFGALREVVSAEEAVRQMAGGAADAAFAWTSLAGDMQGGYSRGTLANLVARGEVAMSDIAIVWRSPAIAHGPVAVLASLPAAEKRWIQEYLLELESAVPGAYDAINPYYEGGYAAVDAEDYRALEPLILYDTSALDLPGAPVEPPTPQVPEGQ